MSQQAWERYNDRSAGVDYIGKEQVGDEWVLCRLCMDTQFLIVNYAWIIMGNVPSDFNVDACCIKSNVRGPVVPNESDMVRIPCDCHSGYRTRQGGKGDEGARQTPIKKFRDYFGSDAKGSYYGQTIIEYRQMLMDYRKESTQEERDAIVAQAAQYIKNMNPMSMPRALPEDYIMPGEPGYVPLNNVTGGAQDEKKQI